MSHSLERESTEHQVIAFLAREIGCRPSDVLLDTDLARDLGVTGDDTFELLDQFFQTFGVKTSNFDSKKHVDLEGAGPTLDDFSAWFHGTRPLKRVLTVQMLVDAAVALEWPSG